MGMAAVAVPHCFDHLPGVQRAEVQRKPLLVAAGPMAKG
jgi:hypothetical protein